MPWKICVMALCVVSFVQLGWSAPASAQDDPLAGQYELQVPGVDGDLSVEAVEGGYMVSVFTTNDQAAHFCFYEGVFVQEEQVLVEREPAAEDELPMIIYIRDGSLEIQEHGPDSCGMNQSMVGLYHPAAE